MNALALPVRRATLGAEELLELGQAPRTQVMPLVSPVAPVEAAPVASRTVGLSRQEGQLLVQVTQDIIDFAKSYPIEFNSYCPTDRWQAALVKVGTWTKEIERQLKAGSQMVSVPADAVLHLVDLEKCVSAARDARLSAAKLAFTFSAVGAIADIVFGLSWIGVPAYLAGLAVLFGRPIVAKFRPEPQEPFKPSIAGRRAALAGCQPPHESDEERRRPKLLERVVLSPHRSVKRFYWGEVHCVPGPTEGSVCIRKGRFRVRVEGWAGDVIVPAEGWSLAEEGDCVRALNEVGVWETPGGPRRNAYGPLWEKSRHERTFWVEYVGPNTDGRIRRAGPFGCPDDTRDHAMEDGGIAVRGIDGDLVLFDGEGNVVETVGGGGTV